MTYILKFLGIERGGGWHHAYIAILGLGQNLEKYTDIIVEGSLISIYFYLYAHSMILQIVLFTGQEIRCAVNYPFQFSSSSLKYFALMKVIIFSS